GPIALDRPWTVEHRLREAAPHEIFEVIRSTIERRHEVVAVRLLMADYASTRLQTVGEPPDTHALLSVDESAPGRAFGAQEPYWVHDEAAGTVDVHLPVSVRGDRLGILSVTLPGAQDKGPRPELIAELQECADALAHEIVVADRDTDLF